MIRQAISCDICGSEKKQTNHWFVAYDQGGELRVSGWNSRNRLRPGTRHLCGQTCLHKLVDDFMDKALSARPPFAAAEEVDFEEFEPAAEAKFAEARAMEGRGNRGPTTRPVESKPAPRAADERFASAKHGSARATDTSLTSNLAYEEFESSARLITPPEPVAPKKPPMRPPLEMVSAAARLKPDDATVPMDEPPRFASRNWRAEAWERERKREQRAERAQTGTNGRRKLS